MLSSAAAAVSQLLDRKFRGVLAAGIAGTAVLFLVLLFGLQWLVAYVPDFGFHWVKEAYRILSASLLTICFVFLGAPIAQLFASLFLDRVAASVEAAHYRDGTPGRAASVLGVVQAGFMLSAISFLLNLLSIPVTLMSFGIGAVVMFFVNGYLTGRTFFELAALRHMTPPQARALRRRHRLRLFAGGAFVSLLSMIPGLNLVVPVFGAAMMTHEFNKLART